MAWLEQEAGYYHVAFRLGNRKFKRSLKTKSKSDAAGRLMRLEENIRLVESGRLEIPADADVTTFLLSDGKLTGPPNMARNKMKSVLSLRGVSHER